MKQPLLIAVTFLFVQNAFALTKTWTGLAGDGLWGTAANWNNNSLPAATDNVVLDNSTFAADYAVTLPNTAVLIKTLTISPAATRIIRLILPVTNTIAPALTVSGPGYGIVINNGGIFSNESGLSTGASLSIADSMRINNDGRYIHSSRSPSASSIVQVLSKAPGTEKGVFEYDVPGTANYDVSVSKRTYGTLVLSAAAAATSRTYTGTGASQLTVNGNLVINAGVTFRANLSGANGNIIVTGDYIQNGGIFNIAYGANNTVVKIAGNLLQSAAGNITETDAGLPSIELNGTSRQSVSLPGSITNSILFRINNPAGAVLQSPLSLPYALDLANGALTTSAANLLTLAAGCSINADSSSSNSYIDGPLRKEGLSGTPWFRFPIGKTGTQQWAGVKNATGNFIVEYIKTDPHTLSAAPDTSLAAVSALGYWVITPDAVPAPSAYVTLSYTGPNNAGITDMATARIAQLSAGSWINRGNTGFTGSAGAAGSVTGDEFNPFPGSPAYFTIAAKTPAKALSITLPDSQDRSPVASGISGFDIRVLRYTNSLVLAIKARRATKLDITLCSMPGAIVEKLRLDAPVGSSSAVIGLAGLSSGIYWLVAKDERGISIVRPFIK